MRQKSQNYELNSMKTSNTLELKCIFKTSTREGEITKKCSKNDNT